MTKDYLRVLMGENIRKERTARNMSIEEFSEKLDLTPGFVGLIERGQRGATAHTLLRVSELFDIPIDRFFASVSERFNNVGEIIEPKSTSERKKKLFDLADSLSERELDFLIYEIKGIKAMNHTRPLS